MAVARAPILVLTLAVIPITACAPLRYLDYESLGTTLPLSAVPALAGMAADVRLGADWVELDLKNEGATTLVVDGDRITFTFADAERRLVEPYVFREPPPQFAAAQLAYMAPFELRATAVPDEGGLGLLALEPGKSVHLVLYPEDLLLPRLGAGPVPTGHLFASADVDEPSSREFRIRLPVAAERSRSGWSALEVRGRLRR